MSGAEEEPVTPDSLLAKMLRLSMVDDLDDPEAAVLDIWNGAVKIMPTSAVSGLRALCTAELHERGEDT